MKMTSSNIGHIMTLANSIIGVGIVAIPLCFQRCGIILSIVLLIISNFITRLCCHYLLKTATKARRKNFEFIASYIFGSSGKLLVELCIIGYLIGTCITYFVVVGDLGPQIISKLFNINESDTLRTWVMVIVTIACIIPLGLLRNIESLSHVCTTSILFYLCLVVKIIAESEEHISSGSWQTDLVFWEPSGVMQCLPIYSMALSCQMQLFEVYDSLPNPTVEKMNEIVKTATNICTGVYIFVGFFGYMAFSNQQFSGNILLNLSTSFASDIIKFGFVLSVAFSFPLVIFPCRASLYSLLYHRSHADVSHYIPEHRFKYITISIVITALIIGIMIPSIEVVIGLVGSTIGVAICIMFPASCFIKTVKKNSTEKLAAQFMLVFGFVLMILGTYANLGAIDEQKSGPVKVFEEIPEIRVTIPDTIQKPDELPGKPENMDVPKLPHNHHQISENLSAVVLDKDYITRGVRGKINLSLKSKSKSKLQSNLNANVKEINLNEPTKDPPEKAMKKKNTVVNVKEVGVQKNVPKEAKVDTADVIVGPKTDLPINKEAIQKEDQEIAIEANDEHGRELEQTKNLLQEVKTVLEKQNQETQKLVRDKIDEISKKVNEIEKAQEIQNHPDDAAVPENKNASNQINSVADGAKIIDYPVNHPLPPAELILNTQNITKQSVDSQKKSDLNIETNLNNQIDNKIPVDNNNNIQAPLDKKAIPPPVVIPEHTPKELNAEKPKERIIPHIDSTKQAQAVGHDLPEENDKNNLRQKRDVKNVSVIPQHTKQCDEKEKADGKQPDVEQKNNVILPTIAKDNNNVFVRDLRSINETTVNTTSGNP